ncbi:MAG TPA: CAP domain-containing protein [Pyrinomonadaceae bacterium]|nr:CAP domain-containing protein [Pyrinomonadaceae bacterium]
MKNLKIFSAFLFIFVSVGILHAQSDLNDKNINIKYGLNGVETAKAMTRPRVIETKSAEKPEKSENALAPISLEKQAFALINQIRAEKGLTLLKWSDDVAKIARMHSQNMANYKFFSHSGLDGKMVNDRADSLGISRWRAIGENIAFNRGYDKPAEFAVEGWMHSSSHQQNLLDSRWVESAIGVAIANDGSYYFTQVFLLRK